MTSASDKARCPVNERIMMMWKIVITYKKEALVKSRGFLLSACNKRKTKG